MTEERSVYRANNCLLHYLGFAFLLSAQVRKKPKEWIPDAVWLNIVALSNMDAFRDIPDSVFRNDGLWRQWYDQEAPEMAKVGAECRQIPAACFLAGEADHAVVLPGGPHSDAKHCEAEETCAIYHKRAHHTASSM